MAVAFLPTTLRDRWVSCSNFMKILGDKIFVKISNEEKEKLFKKKIRRDDGSEVELFINVPATDHADERTHSLFVQTGIIVGVGHLVEGIEPGDIAILDFQVSNLVSNFVYKDGEDEVFWINATTTYHKADQVAYANRRSPKDQIVFKKGDYDEMSMLLGIVRGERLIARQPYVFLHHEENSRMVVSEAGLILKEEDKVLSRKVLSVSLKTTEMMGIRNGDEIMVDDRDIFDVTIDGRKMSAVNDVDVFLLK